MARASGGATGTPCRLRLNVSNPNQIANFKVIRPVPNRCKVHG